MLDAVGCRTCPHLPAPGVGSVKASLRADAPRTVCLLCPRASGLDDAERRRRERWAEEAEDDQAGVLGLGGDTRSPRDARTSGGVDNGWRRCRD